jgi:hypothetical protein
MRKMQAHMEASGKGIVNIVGGSSSRENSQGSYFNYLDDGY